MQARKHFSPACSAALKDQVNTNDRNIYLSDEHPVSSSPLLVRAILMLFNNESRNHSISWVGRDPQGSPKSSSWLCTEHPKSHIMSLKTSKCFSVRLGPVTTSLGEPVSVLNHLWTKTFFLISKPNLSWHSFILFPQVLPLATREKRINECPSLHFPSWGSYRLQKDQTATDYKAIPLGTYGHHVATTAYCPSLITWHHYMPLYFLQHACARKSSNSAFRVLCLHPACVCTS